MSGYKFAVAIYRVSTIKQDIESQERFMKGEITRRKLVEVPHARFKQPSGGLVPEPNQCVIVTDKCTGRTSHRKTYGWVLGQVQAGKVSSVLVYDHTRLGRNLQANEFFAKECKRMGTELFSGTKMVDLSSAEGIFQFQVLSAMAEYFSNRLGEKIKEVYQQKLEDAGGDKSKVKWGGRPPNSTNPKQHQQMDIFTDLVKQGKTTYYIWKKLGWDKKTIRRHRARIERGEDYVVVKTHTM